VSESSSSATDGVALAHGADKHGRLEALERKYDPTNFFRPEPEHRPD
jgi:hypothetical protein